MQEKKINFQVTLEFISFTLKVKLGSSTCTLKVKGSSLTLLSIRTRDSAWTLGSWYPAPKYEKRSVEIKGISQVHILLYGDKFNGEIDIVQFIFTRCVVYSFEQKLSLHKNVEKYRVTHMYLNDFVRLFRGHWVT